MIAKKAFLYIFLLLLSACIFAVGFMPKAIYEPKVFYQVYLDGEKIGLIDNKEELIKYINDEQSKIKKQYNVSKVYEPEGLEIKKIITYKGNVLSSKKIYEKIKNLDSFTINGYKITIKNNSEIKTLYAMNEKIFKNSMSKMIKTFVDEDKYEAYISSKQEAVKTTGSIIEDVYINEDIVIEKNKISINNKIFTNEEELIKYLIYGTTEKQATYVVSEEDTIENIAYNNKLSVQEFLVANSEFNSENVILLTGQIVNIGYINPVLTIIEKSYIVKDETKKFTTEIIYDSNLVKGMTYIKQEGVDGLNRVSQRVTSQNGEVTDVEILNTEELTPAITQIIVKGDKYVSNVGIEGYWYWPTTRPYIITSPYGWRYLYGGQWHPAIDIAGPGKGSPIYSANNGNVVNTGYNSARGNYIVVDHNNGFYSLYEHLDKILVSEGIAVARGQVIGTMGHTGKVVGNPGTHLHFGICRNNPLKDMICLNPMRFY